MAFIRLLCQNIIISIQRLIEAMKVLCVDFEDYRNLVSEFLPACRANCEPYLALRHSILMCCHSSASHLGLHWNWHDHANIQQACVPNARRQIEEDLVHFLHCENIRSIVWSVTCQRIGKNVDHRFPKQTFANAIATWQGKVLRILVRYLIRIGER